MLPRFDKNLSTSLFTENPHQLYKEWLEPHEDVRGGSPE